VTIVDVSEATDDISGTTITPSSSSSINAFDDSGAGVNEALLAGVGVAAALFIILLIVGVGLAVWCRRHRSKGAFSAHQPVVSVSDLRRQQTNQPGLHVCGLSIWLES